MGQTPSKPDLFVTEFEQAIAACTFQAAKDLMSGRKREDVDNRLAACLQAALDRRQKQMESGARSKKSGFNLGQLFTRGKELLDRKAWLPAGTGVTEEEATVPVTQPAKKQRHRDETLEENEADIVWLDLPPTQSSGFKRVSLGHHLPSGF